MYTPSYNHCLRVIITHTWRNEPREKRNVKKFKVTSRPPEQKEKRHLTLKKFDRFSFLKLFHHSFFPPSGLLN
jgi:hypothetical protein